MQITRIGNGPWPDVQVEGVKVTLSAGKESLVFDCAELQADVQTVLDVVRTHDGRLAVGAANGTAYLAHLTIPPRRYEGRALPLAEAELPEGLDPMCITSAPTMEWVRLPMSPEDMAAVRLVLWPVPNAGKE